MRAVVSVSGRDVVAVSYDGARHALNVDFRSGEHRRYDAVPEGVFRAVAADSSGAVFDDRVRHHFDWTKTAAR
jgi:hypothetical protein